jgi:hypothetical protein
MIFGSLAHKEGNAFGYYTRINKNSFWKKKINNKMMVLGNLHFNQADEVCRSTNLFS